MVRILLEGDSQSDPAAADKYLATIATDIAHHRTAAGTEQAAATSKGVPASVEGDAGYRYVQKLSRDQCNKVSVMVVPWMCIGAWLFHLSAFILLLILIPPWSCSQLLLPTAPGSFILRPHEVHFEHQFFLSFRGAEQEGVKHAIVRREVVQDVSAVLCLGVAIADFSSDFSLPDLTDRGRVLLRGPGLLLRVRQDRSLRIAHGAAQVRHDLFDDHIGSMSLIWSAFFAPQGDLADPVGAAAVRRDGGPRHGGALPALLAGPESCPLPPHAAQTHVRAAEQRDSGAVQRPQAEQQRWQERQQPLHHQPAGQKCLQGERRGLVAVGQHSLQR